MMFAPLKTNLMAPLSTCWCGRMKGSKSRKINHWNIRRLNYSSETTGTGRPHIYATILELGRTVLLSVWRKGALHSQSGFQCVRGWNENRKKNCLTKGTLQKMQMMTNSKWPYHLTILTGSFLGIIWLSHGSMSGNCSNSWFLMPLITEVFSWMQLDTFSFSSNLKWKK